MCLEVDLEVAEEDLEEKGLKEEIGDQIIRSVKDIGDHNIRMNNLNFEEKFEDVIVISKDDYRNYIIIQ